MEVEDFIVEYMSGLTNFVFDRSVLERIAIDRGCSEVDSVDSLSQQDKDLLRADLLYTAYCGPDTIANRSQSHGSYTQSVGSQKVNKSDLFKIFMYLYQKYDDPMLEQIQGNMQWLDF